MTPKVTSMLIMIMKNVSKERLFNYEILLQHFDWTSTAFRQAQRDISV